MSTRPTILVTAATGQLGRLVMDELMRRVPAEWLSVLVRDPARADHLASAGVRVHRGDYAEPDTLAAAFAGVDRLLLISSSAVGARAVQHRNAIAAAKRAGVGLVVYTSLLHADTSPLGLAAEHRDTEAALAEAALPHVVLRNGWYTENYTASIAAALAHGTQLGSAGAGRISSAARADYAAAAAAVLTAADKPVRRVYELAGDTGYTLAEYAAELARQSGKPVVYTDMPEAAFREALLGAGLPPPIAGLLADSDAGAARGALFDDGRALSTLIGRPTTPMAATVAAALRG